MKRPKNLSFYLKNPFVIIYSIFRLLCNLSIFVNVVWGFFLIMLADYWDGYFYEMVPKLVEMPRPTYQIYDKFQDWMSYIFMWIVAFNHSSFKLLTGLLLFRLVGQLFYFLIKKQFVFVIFANFFEAMFLWLIVLPLMNIHPSIYWFYILITLYELREVFLHIYWPWRLKKYGFPNFLQKYFGARKEAIW